MTTPIRTRAQRRMRAVDSAIWLLLCSAMSASCVLPGMTADRDSEAAQDASRGAAGGRDGAPSTASTTATGAFEPASMTSHLPATAGAAATVMPPWSPANAGTNAGLSAAAGGCGEGGAAGTSDTALNADAGGPDGEAGAGDEALSPSVPAKLAVFPELSLPFEIRAASSGACLLAGSAEQSSVVLAQDLSACAASAGRFWLVRASENAYRMLSSESGLTLAAQGPIIVQGAARSDTLWAIERPRGITERPGGPFVLRAVGTKHCLEAATSAGVSMADCADGANQQWSFRFAFETPLSLLAKNSEMCLDVPPDGDALQQYYCHGHSNQRWGFRPIAPVLDGSAPTYLISSTATGRCLGVEDDSLDTHALIREAACTGAPAQRWSVTSFSDDFQITNQHSGQCLDVWNGALTSSTPLQQFPCHDGSNQRFRVVNAAQRRLSVYQVARSDGSGRATIDADLLGRQVDLINTVYSPTGIWLEYQPAALGVVDSDALYALGDDAAKSSDCRDGQLLAPAACANLIAADTPDEVVVFVTPGNRTAEQGDAFLTIAPVESNASATCASFAGVRAAREFGSLLGLVDPSVRRASLVEIEATYLAAQSRFRVFDGDGLDDTEPLPYWNDPWLVCDSTAPNLPFFDLSLGGQPLTVYAGNVMSPYVTAQRTLSASQVNVVRATGFARHW